MSRSTRRQATKSTRRNPRTVARERRRTEQRTWWQANAPNSKIPNSLLVRWARRGQA